MIAERKASVAETEAIGMARRATHLMPHRLMRVKNENDGDGHGFDRQRRKVPVLERCGGKERGQPARRYPTPPVASAGQHREDGIIGPEGLRARARDAAHTIGPHEDKLGPRRRRGPAEQNANDEQRHRRAALAEDCALADEQRRDDEDHLIAAAHGQGGCAHPAQHARVWRRRNDTVCRRSHFDAPPGASRVAPRCDNCVENAVYALVIRVFDV